MKQDLKEGEEHLPKMTLEEKGIYHCLFLKKKKDQILTALIETVNALDFAPEEGQVNGELKRHCL